MDKKNYDELFRKSLLTIKTLKQRLEEQKNNNEKIAIIGMACRFPGGSDTLENYWALLNEGKNSVTDIPKSRFNITDYYDPVHGKPGKMYVKQENFLTQDISGFDSKFFGISNVEANEMDPQQRFLYEVTWEALENAGINIAKLKGSKTGLFLGISSSGEYSKVPRDTSKLNQYIGTGTTSSMASGRLSYSFGFNGPAISIDTACSSSLVSTHLAVDSLRKGESDIAISAGVSLMISPEIMSSLCAMNALSEDGKSKPFDESANGYGRGEGCGAVILKRLSDAERDNDKIYAVIDGSAINNDGESSNLTVPSGIAQQKVIESALKNAGLSPDDIDYIETHGTGTLLGDPIEFDAIKSVFLTMKNKRKSALKIGAVKGNIGHLEAAAGIAGFIKVVLCLYKNKMVKIANFQKLNPRIKTDGMPVEFLTQTIDWNSDSDHVRRAGLSSFGFSGTNAHMILSEYNNADNKSEDMPEYLLNVTAKTEKAVIEIIKRYKSLFENKADINVSEVCYTANSFRDKFVNSSVFIGKNRTDFIQAFDKVISFYEEKNTIYDAKAQLVGSSEGDDRLNAKRQIYKSISKNVYTACVDKMIKPKYAFVFRDSGEVLQEAVKKLYAFLPSFKKKLDSYLEIIEKRGITENFFDYKISKNDEVSDLFLLTAYVSVGEFFNELGICFEITVGERIGDYSAAVLSKIITFNLAAELIISKYDKTNAHILSPSDINRPASRYLAFENSLMLIEKQDLYNYFSKTGSHNSGLFEKNINILYQQGYRFFWDFGSGDKKISDVLNSDDVISINIFNSDDIVGNLLSAMAECISLGSDIEWDLFYEGMKINKTLIPNYAFDNVRHWVSSPKKNGGLSEGMAFTTEKFKGHRINLPELKVMYKFTFGLSNFQEIMDNSGVVHMGYYLEMLQNIMSQEYPDKNYTIKNMEFITPLTIMDDEVREVIVILDKDGKNIAFKIYNKSIEQSNWNQNMKGNILIDVSKNEKIYDIKEIEDSCKDKFYNSDEFYEPLENNKGFYFGHSVRWVDSIACGKKEGYVKFRHIDNDDICFEYSIKVQPGILDSCAQSCNFMSIDFTPDGKKYMVNSMENVMIFPENYVDDNLSAHIEFKQFFEDKKSLDCSVCLLNTIGKPIVEIGNITLKEFSEEQIRIIQEMMNNTLHGEGKDTAFIMQFMQATTEKKYELMQKYVITVMADILEEKTEELDPNEALDNLGLDSMSGLDFYNRITEQLGVEMPFAQLAECSNLADCANKLSDKLQGKATDFEEDLSDENILEPEKWIYNYKEKPNVKARIFCFPNGFRSADMFDSWQKQLGDDIQVCAIQIPGMDMKRIKEKAPEYVDEFTKTLVMVLEKSNLLDVPCASFGHSWGSLFSYRLGYYLDNNEKANYKKLFVSGFTSPSIKNSSVVKLLDGIENQGFHRIPTYDEIKNDKSAVDLMVKAFEKLWGYDEKGTRAVLNMLLSACVLIDRYEFDPNEKINVPVVAFHGIDDYVVKIEEMNQWQVIAANEFRLFTMKGDHQFVNENQSESQLLEAIKSEINKMIK